jgi:hypothetical protein
MMMKVCKAVVEKRGRRIVGAAVMVIQWEMGYSHKILVKDAEERRDMVVVRRRRRSIRVWYEASSMLLLMLMRMMVMIILHGQNPVLMLCCSGLCQSCLLHLLVFMCQILTWFAGRGGD